MTRHIAGAERLLRILRCRQDQAGHPPSPPCGCRRHRLDARAAGSAERPALRPIHFGASNGCSNIAPNRVRTLGVEPVSYEPDWIDGRAFPPRVIKTDAVISGTHIGSVGVEAGRLSLLGTLRGTLVVHRRAEVVIHGTQAGSVDVHEGAIFTVLGALIGESRVGRGGLVIVEPTGRLAGGVTNGGARRGARRVRRISVGRWRVSAGRCWPDQRARIYRRGSDVHLARSRIGVSGSGRRAQVDDVAVSPEGGDGRARPGPSLSHADVRAYKRAASQLREVLRGPAEGLSLSFKLAASKGQPATSSLDVGERVHRHAALLRPFMAADSPIELRGVWDRLRADLDLDPDIHRAVELVFEAAARLPVSFVLNDRPLTARDIYFAYGDGAYFSDNPEASAVLNSFAPAPQPLIVMLFHEACANYTHVALVLLEHVRSWERAYPTPPGSDDARARCIYCLSDDGDFGPEEHVIPESLIGDAAVLRNAVCAKCNNRLSELDMILIESEPIAFLRVFYGPLTKKGKFPTARFRDVDIERTAPRALRVLSKGGRRASPPEQLPDGSYRFTIDVTGRRPFDPVPLGRALFKTALGLLALNEGVNVALEARYDAARAFVLDAAPLPTPLLLLRKGKPTRAITVTVNPTLLGTPVRLDIYGLVAAFLLEGTPVTGMPANEPHEVMVFWLDGATRNDAATEAS